MIELENFEPEIWLNYSNLLYKQENQKEAIDVLYEAHTRVIVSAAVSPDKLYSGHDHSYEFERTISRLNEMQSAEYQAISV